MKKRTLKLASNIAKIAGCVFLGVTQLFLLKTAAKNVKLPEKDPVQIEKPVEKPDDPYEIEYDLPKESEAEQFWKELGIDTDYSSYTKDGERNYTFTRQSVPSQPIKLNMCMELTEELKENYTAAVGQLNDIFKVINPAYSFDINFSPSEEDLKYRINVDVHIMNAAEEEKAKKIDAAGWWDGMHYIYHYNESGWEKSTCCSEIKIRKDCIADIEVLIHEMLHHLGLGDGYILENKDQLSASIMNNNAYITRNDVGLLAGLYGEYSTPESKAKLVDFVNNFENNRNLLPKDETLVQGYLKEICNRFSVSESDINFDISAVFSTNVETSVSYLKNTNIKCENRELIVDETNFSFGSTSSKSKIHKSKKLFNVDGKTFVSLGSRGCLEMYFIIDNALYTTNKFEKICDLSSQDQYLENQKYYENLYNMDDASLHKILDPIRNGYMNKDISEITEFLKTSGYSDVNFDVQDIKIIDRGQGNFVGEIISQYDFSSPEIQRTDYYIIVNGGKIEVVQIKKPFNSLDYGVYKLDNLQLRISTNFSSWYREYLVESDGKLLIIAQNKEGLQIKDEYQIVTDAEMQNICNNAKAEDYTADKELAEQIAIIEENKLQIREYLQAQGYQNISFEVNSAAYIQDVSYGRLSLGLYKFNGSSITTKSVTYQIDEENKQLIEEEVYTSTSVLQEVIQQGAYFVQTDNQVMAVGKFEDKWTVFYSMQITTEKEFDELCETIRYEDVVSENTTIIEEDEM